MSEAIEWTDRYGPAGPPSLIKGCHGPCEATGYIPIYMAEGDIRPHDQTLIDHEEETDPTLIALWRVAEQVRPSEDGWHFVPCPACNGTGITPWPHRLGNVFGYLRGKARFARLHVFVWPYSAKTARMALAWHERHPEASIAHEDPLDEIACPFRTNYGDRLDLRRPWLTNRRIALRVLFGRGGR